MYTIVKREKEISVKYMGIYLENIFVIKIIIRPRIFMQKWNVKT